MLPGLDISLHHVGMAAGGAQSFHKRNAANASIRANHDCVITKAPSSCITRYMRVARRTVLYVGNDPLLSKSTCGLLRAMGYNARTCMPANIRLMVRNAEFQAVVLCATISSDEADQVVKNVFQERPQTPIISIHVGLLGDTPHPASTYIVDALAGPNALIAAMQSALSRHHASESAESRGQIG